MSFSRDLRRQIRYNARSPARFAFIPTELGLGVRVFGLLVLEVMLWVFSVVISEQYSEQTCDEKPSFETNYKPLISPLRPAEIAEQ